MDQPLALKRSALFVATLTSFMGPFMISAVNVALPAIQAQFSVNAVQLSWVATSFLLAVAVTLMPIGRIADIHGRKKVFLIGLVLYTLASFFGAFSNSVEMLIFFRIIQGVGTAMFVTTGMAILTSIFPPYERGRVIGIYVAAVYIGLSVGPSAGGILTQQFGWQSIFWVVAPFGAASAWITFRFLKGEWADARGEKLDVIGSLLYAGAIFLLVYGASLMPQPQSVFMMAIGLLAGLAFIGWEMKIPYPVFEVRLFTTNRLFAFSSLAALINYSATYAVTFLMSLYLQYIKALSAQQAGFILVAQPLVMAIFSPLAGRLSDRIEPRKIASTGMGLTALGLVLFMFLKENTSTGYVLGTLAVLGFGFGLFSSPNMNAIMGSVEKRLYGIASGTVATMRLLGQMTSMAIAMVTFAVLIGHRQITPQNYDLFLTSVHVAFSISAVLCLLGIVFSLMRGPMQR